MKQIKQKPKEIYLLLGENSIEKNEFINTLILEAENTYKGLEKIKISHITDENWLQKFVEEYTHQNLFSSYKLIILELPDNLKKQEKEILKNLLSQKQENIQLIIVSNLSPYKFDKQISLAVEKNNGVVKTFWKPFEANIPNIIREKLFSSGIETGERITQLLLERNGTNINSIIEEINYIRNYFKTTKIVREEEAINILLLKKGESSIFDLANSLIKGDKKKSITLLNQLLDKSEEIFVTSSIVFNTIYKYLKVRKLLNQRLSETEIASSLGISNFEVKNIIKNISNVDDDKAKKLIKLCYQLDSILRTSHTPEIKKVQIEMSIMKLL